MSFSSGALIFFITFLWRERVGSRDLLWRVKKISAH